MDLQLTGKQVCITGGSNGIGLAVARKFAEEGSEVAILARDREKVMEEARIITAEYGVRALGITCDVTRPEDIEAARAALETAFGGIDILINNAGTGTKETAMEADDARWYYYIDLHLMAAVRMVKAFVPYMRKRGGGVILQTASICAKQPLWYEPIYNTTKAALVMYGKCLANELISDNIRVNTISPGLVLTQPWKAAAENLAPEEGSTPKEFLAAIAEDYAPIGRFASPEEIAEYYVFLASDKAGYSVGSNYSIDGGWLRVTD